MLAASLIAFGAILVAWLMAPEAPRAKAPSVVADTTRNAVPAHA